MVKYRYALDSNGEIVSAESLVGTTSRCTYTCVSCERELIARVNGTIQRPHFGHKSVIECNGETYLHRLAKKAFVETFQKCQREGVPFTIRFDAPRVCNRFKSLTKRVCDVGNDRHEYDLTQYYTDLRVEKRDGEFIPDVSLHSTDRPDDIVYIEIAVTHFLSEEKTRSGKRIIEIPVSDEDDIDRIRNASVDDEHATFKGFFPTINVIPDAECNCARENYFAFYVFRSGKAFLDHGSLRSLQNKINSMKSSLLWLHLTKERPHNDGYGYYNEETPSTLFVTNVNHAFSKKVPFKNCYLCRYHGQSWDESTEHGVYCKTYRKSCNSNDANTCDRYRLPKYRTGG